MDSVLDRISTLSVASEVRPLPASCSVGNDVLTVRVSGSSMVFEVVVGDSSYVETEEILADTHLMTQLAQSRIDILNGDFVDLEDLDDALDL